MGHSHDHGQLSDRRLIGAVAVNVLLTVAQIVAGIVGGSLALIADALHNLNDAGSLALALAARRIARRPPDKQRTFGYRRAEVVGAVINLTALILVGLYLIYEAIDRFLDPREIDGTLVIIVGVVALVVDLATAFLTQPLAKEGDNTKAAFVHNLADAFGSLAVVVTGALVLWLGWRIADPITTLLIAGYVLYQGITMMRDAVRILMESTPEGIDLDEVATALRELDGIDDVHHVHIWQLDEKHRALEAHVVVPPRELTEPQPVLRAAAELLAERFGIGHATLQPEPRGAACEEGLVPEH